MRQNLAVLNFIIKGENKSEFAYTVGMTRRKQFKTRRLTDTALKL